MKEALKNISQLGKLCPLCKKGLIIYVRFGEGFMAQYEFVHCSNEKCSANRKIR